MPEMRRLLCHRMPALNNISRLPWIKGNRRKFELGNPPGPSFSPADLFANDEEGVWFDPSDLSTMFQDSTGTTPVTADGQPVGLILDKSKGLVLGPELVTNGTFSADSGWSKGAGTTISGGKANIETTITGYVLYQNTAGIQETGLFEVSFTISNYVSGIIKPYVGTPDPNVPNFSQNGTFTLRIKNNGGGTELGLYSATNVFSGSVDNFSIKTLAGNHAVQATAAARPLHKTDGTYHWLQFDGVDDSLSTAAIDFTATDKMDLFVGVRVAGTTNQMPVSTGPSGNGRADILYLAGSSPVARGTLIGGSGGIAQISTPSPGAAPIKVVNTGIFDIAGLTATDEIKLRQNGVLGTQDVLAAGPAGTGNFGDYELTLGDTNASTPTFPFNGNLYSSIVRGALSSAQEITDTETWVNSKTGAY